MIAEQQQSLDVNSDSEFLDQIMGYVQHSGDLSDNIQQMNFMTQENILLLVPEQQQPNNSNIYKNLLKDNFQQSDFVSDIGKQPKLWTLKNQQSLDSDSSQQDGQQQELNDKSTSLNDGSNNDNQISDSKEANTSNGQVKKPRQRKATQKRYRDRKKEQKWQIEIEIGDLQEKVGNMKLINGVFQEESSKLKSLIDQQQQVDINKKQSYGKVIFWLKLSQDFDGKVLTEEYLKCISVQEWQGMYVKWVLHLQELLRKLEKDVEQTEKVKNQIKDSLENLVLSILRIGLLNPDVQKVINPVFKSGLDVGEDVIQQAQKLMDKIQINKSQMIKMLLVNNKLSAELCTLHEEFRFILEELIQQFSKNVKNAQVNQISYSYTVQKKAVFIMQTFHRFFQVYQEMLYLMEHTVYEMLGAFEHVKLARAFVYACPSYPLLKMIVSLVSLKGQEILKQAEQSDLVQDYDDSQDLYQQFQEADEQLQKEVQQNVKKNFAGSTIGIKDHPIFK